MAICPNCGGDNRDGVWTCASCGQPMGAGDAGAAGGGYEEPPHDHDYYNAPTAYGTSAPHIPPLGRQKKPGEGSPLVKIVIVGGVLAVAAIFLAWFFLLRGGGGDAFLGKWRPVEGNKNETIEIKRSGGDIAITFVGADGEGIGPFKAKVSGDKLETTLEYAGDDPKMKAQAQLFRTFASAMVEDFKMVFQTKGDGLTVRVEGKAREGAETTGLNETTELEKAD